MVHKVFHNKKIHNAGINYGLLIGLHELLWIAFILLHIIWEFP